MPHYTIYRAATGEIEQVVSCPEFMRDLQTREGTEILDGNYDDPETYIDLKTLEAISRPRMTYALDKNTVEADGKDEARLTGLPAGTLITLRLPENRGAFEVRPKDGTLYITATDPGDYEISIEPPFPYLPAKEIISAR